MFSDVRLQGFRSYDDASFEFSPSVNIIVGPNGSGKTNLLEALLVLSLGSSYRVHDTELIKHDSPWLRLEAHILPAADERVVKILADPASKTFDINGQKVLRLTEKNVIPVVLFEPNHLQLLSGSPENRRQYIDDVLDILSPGFRNFRRNYKRTLSQRNTLLKRSHKPSTQELFPWNLRLSELGAAIARARAEYIEGVARELPELYANLSSAATTVTITYENQFPLADYENRMFHKLETNLNNDLERGFTSCGPHREDFLVSFDGKQASEVASRGETRTAVLALKIIELQSLEQKTGKTPLLLLDDVFSELDGARRRALTAYLQRYQTFLTTTDADVVVKHFTDCTIIPLGS